MPKFYCIQCGAFVCEIEKGKLQKGMTVNCAKCTQKQNNCSKKDNNVDFLTDLFNMT